VAYTVRTLSRQWTLFVTPSPTLRNIILDYPSVDIPVYFILVCCIPSVQLQDLKPLCVSHDGVHCCCCTRSLSLATGRLDHQASDRALFAQADCMILALTLQQPPLSLVVPGSGCKLLLSLKALVASFERPRFFDHGFLTLEQSMFFVVFPLRLLCIFSAIDYDRLDVPEYAFQGPGSDG
jgi:hypothetical protein